MLDHLYDKLQHIASRQGISIETLLETFINDHLSEQQTDWALSNSAHDDKLFYRSLVRSMSEGVIVHDTNGTIVFINPGAERILGLSRDQLLGNTLDHPHLHMIDSDGSPLPPEKHPALVTLRTGEAQSEVIIGINKPDQSVTWIATTSHLLYLDDKAENVIVVSFTDISAQKQIEDGLRESQARLQAILDSIPGTIFIVNREHRIISMYSAVARAEGIDYLSLIGKNIGDIMPEDAARANREAITKAFDTGEHQKFVSYSHTGRWYDNRVAPVIENGAIIAVTMTAINIDERVIAERRLRRSEARMRAILESTPGSIVTVDRDMIIREIYSALARELGIDYRSKVGKPIDLIIRPENTERIHNNIQAVFENGEQRKFEALSLTERWYTVHLAPVREDGEVTAVTLISLEISERKRMEQVIQDSEAQIRTLLDSIPGMIVSVDRDGNIFSNNAVVEAGEEQWTSIYETTRSEHENEIIRSQIEAAFERRESRHAEMLATDNRWYDVRSAPVIENGEVVAVTFISMDIHDRKMAEERKRALIAEQERVRVLTQFIRDTTHEFRTPLSVINSSLYMIEKVDDVEKRQRHVGMIQSQVHSLTRLIDDLVLMARLDGNPGLQPYPYNMDMLVRQAITPLSEDVSVTYHTDANLPYLYGDAEEIRRALDHLIDNAIRYGSSEIAIQVRHDDQQIVTTITDYGEGMTEEQLGRIFERFYRGNPAHTIRGFGLGLPIVRRIVERHHGTIDVTSAIGQGTTVRISLPLSTNSATK